MTPSVENPLRALTQAALRGDVQYGQRVALIATAEKQNGQSRTFLGCCTEEYGLSDRQSTDASDRAVDSRVVLVRTNDRFQHFWRRTC